MTKLAKVLVLRTDRLGDVLMSLPALALLRQSLPETQIDFMCRREIAEVLAGYLISQRIRAVPVAEGSALDIRSGFVPERYDAALVLYAPAAITIALRLSGIKIRIGIFSKALSFLTFTGGVRQRRSRAEKNEAEYNLELARKFLARVGVTPSLDVPAPIELAPDLAASDSAETALRTLGVETTRPFVVVHPGMGGSALNLSPQQYLDLITAIESELAVPVIVTVGPSALDQAMAKGLRASRPDLKIFQGQSLSALKETFRKATHVIGPSTGPLHLAHLVGTSTVGLYSPVRSQHPDRWRPWGGSGRSRVVFPTVDCRGTSACLGEKCPLYFCFQSYAWTARVIAEATGA